jgi:hypothetical protein
MEVEGGASAGTITFTSAGGDLKIFQASQGFQGSIAGFGSPPGVTEEIDLLDIAFTQHTHVKFVEAPDHLSGTLTVRNDTQTASITLLGRYHTADFSLASDGQGGTIITDPLPLVGSAATSVLAAQM